MRSISDTLNRVATILSILIMVIYPPIIFVGIGRIYSKLLPDLDILHNNGVPLKALKKMAVVVLILLSTLMTFYGICLGVFSMHLSLWILKFFNIFIESRPLPQIESIIRILLLSISLNTLAIFLGCKRWRYASV